LDVGYWCVTLFKDVLEYYENCDSCQRVGGLNTMNLAKMVISLPKKPFMKWSLNFIRPIQLACKHTRNKFILVRIDYATKWVEAKVVRTNTIAITTMFIYECILTRFNYPLTLVTYQRIHFSNDHVIKHMTKHLLLKHKYLLSAREWTCIIN
jgi:hypothetical protein